MRLNRSTSSTADRVAPVSGDQVLAIDHLRSTLGTLSEEQREAAAASFFEQHALPVVEGRFCTFATRAAADGLYLRHRVNLWPDDLTSWSTSPEPTSGS